VFNEAKTLLHYCLSHQESDYSHCNNFLISYILFYQVSYTDTNNISVHDSEDSSSNYQEVVYLLFEISSQTDDVLVFDELVPRLHPRVLKHLYQIFDSIKRQVIILTNSLLFADRISDGAEGNLVYLRREECGVSKFVDYNAIQ